MDHSTSAPAILQALLKITELLLQSERWSLSIESALAELGTAAEVGRVYISENQLTPEGRSVTTVTHKWIRSGVIEGLHWESADLDHPVQNQLAVWIEEMRGGQAVGGPVSRLSKEVVEFLRATDVKSLLMLPVNTEGHWWGILTLEDTLKEREWSDDERHAVLAVAAVIGASILRRRESNAQRQEEKLFALILESMSDMVHIVDRDLRLTHCNKAFREWARSLGVNLEDYQGRRLSEICPFLDPKIFDDYRRMFDDAEPLYIEETTIDGERVTHTDTHKNPVVENGVVTKVVTVIRDVTHRREMEKKLRNSEERLRAIMNQAPDGIFIETADEFMVDVNEAACLLSGYSREELLRMRTRDLETPEMAALPANPFYTEFDQTQSIKFDTSMHAKDGRLYHVEVHVSVLSHSETPLFLSIVRDITKRKEDEREKERLIAELQEALNRIKVLNGLVPICSNCHKIRDDKGFWNHLEEFISQHSEATFTHGICPECREKLYPELADDHRNDSPQGQQ